MDLIHIIQHVEKKCESATNAYIESHSSVFQEVQSFDNLYQQLYLFATCYWGCHGREHIFEYLAGKCVSTIIVAKRALYQGYYDEALLLTRTLAEIANLLNLFWVKPDQIRRWADSDESARIRDFGPAAVRRALEKAEWIIPFGQMEYKRLCDTVHPVPNIGPNAHQNESQPVLGGIFQEKGFKLVYRELAYGLVFVCGPTAKLALIERKHAEKMVELTIHLAELIELIPTSACSDENGYPFWRK